MDFAIGGISIAAVIFGIVEASKQFGVSGKQCQVLALILGIFFVGLAQAIKQELIATQYIPYVEWLVTALAGGLSAMGFYDFLGKRNEPAA